MTNEPTPPSPNPEDGGANELVPADELAAVLAQASEAADELSNEVGAPEGEAIEPSNDISSLDEQLDELERLVAKAGSELDERFVNREQMSPTELGVALVQSIDDATPGSGDAAAGDVPDFMSEFTSPAAAAEESAPEPEPQEGTPAHPPGVVGTPNTFEESAPSADAPKSEPSATKPVARRIDGRKILAAFMQRAGQVANPVALKACEKALVGLDVVDRPLERFGDRARLVVGWVGLATFGTAMVVYMLSLL